MTVLPERPAPVYRERVWPAPWVLLSLALVLPASLLVFLPINPLVGVGTGVVLYGGLVVLLVIGSPTLEVTERGFTAGRATLPARHIGRAEGFSRADATRERGPNLDARAWLLIRGWVDGVVRVEVADDRDPVPYWLVSTRRPDELVSALDRVRPRTPGR
ncbi:DUF3093 domain-containing protein [Lysobacter korlensis]|uniref:DUF3093 domain-containing protein n=1 Tax=Lysobacter korlensis TaxID=553636 RepID=A0ABV6RM86_9GAMM